MMKRTVFNLMVKILLLIFAHFGKTSNIILNGDFQNHPILDTITTCTMCSNQFYYQQTFSSDFISYNWQDQIQIHIHFRTLHLSTNISTTVLDLCGKTNIIAMQNVTMINNAYYRLTFDICKNQHEECSYFYSEIGGTILYENQTLCSTRCIHYQNYFRSEFSGMTSLRFMGYNFDYLVTNCNYGPLLDNVTLTQIQQMNQTIQMKLRPNKQLLPQLSILTNISLNKHGLFEMLCQNFKQFQTKKSVYQRASFKQSNEKTFEIIIQVQQDIQTENCSILINQFVLNDTIYRFTSGNLQIVQQLTFLTELDYVLVNKLSQINKPVSVRLRDTMILSRFLGIGSIFIDLFSFWQIASYYHYISLQTPSFVKYTTQDCFESFIQINIFNQIQLGSYVYPEYKFSISEKIPQSQNQWQYFREFGFTSYFYQSNLQGLLLIGVGLLRSGIFQIIYLIIGFKLFRMNKKWYNNLLYDIVSWIPFFLLVPSIIMATSFNNFAQKINYLLHIITMHICLLTPFLFLIQNSSTIFYKLKPQKQKRKQVQIIYTFLQFIFIMLLTFLTGISNKNAFLAISSILITIKLGFLIHKRCYFRRVDFFCKLSIQLIWALYNAIFLCFRLIEILQQQNKINLTTDVFWKNAYHYLGIIVLLVFSVGGWFFMLATLVNLLGQIKQIILRIKQDCEQRVLNTQQQNKIDIINQNIRQKSQIKKNKIAPTPQKAFEPITNIFQNIRTPCEKQEEKQQFRTYQINGIKKFIRIKKASTLLNKQFINKCKKEWQNLEDLTVNI